MKVMFLETQFLEQNAPNERRSFHLGVMAVRQTAIGGGFLRTDGLSEEAWALLGLLHRASHGGPRAPSGFEKAYAELQREGLIATAITAKGEAALREHYVDHVD